MAQVLISFTLNIKKELTEAELAQALEEDCPMAVSDTDLFEVSTESWQIVK